MRQRGCSEVRWQVTYFKWSSRWLQISLNRRFQPWPSLLDAPLENVRDEDDKNFDLIHCWHHLHDMMRIWLLFIHLQDNLRPHSWPSRYLLTFMVRWKHLMESNRNTMLHCWLGRPENMQNTFKDGSWCETFFSHGTQARFIAPSAVWRCANNYERETFSAAPVSVQQ